MPEPDAPFWRAKRLDQLTHAEWESLCDGCGKCCLCKLEDIDTGDIHYTNVACRLLDLRTCRCTDYARRTERVADCVALGRRDAGLRWLPATCAYRLLDEGKDLPAWHPLVTGDPDSTHAAGRSVLGRVIPEDEAGDLEQHLIGVEGF